MKRLPSISVVTPTFNSARTLDLCFSKLVSQNYDKKKIQIIVADGGSSDITLKIAKKYKAKIIKINPRKQNAEYNKGVGVKYAKNDIVLFLDHDNIMPHKEWLQNIVQPFLDDKEIVGSEPARFHYDKKMTVLDRYFALFGGSDPVVYYLGKNSHLTYFQDKYNNVGKVKNMKNYFKITFSKKNVPALGGNGAAIRRDKLIKFARSDPDNFIHGDVVYDLILSGNNNYALVKDSIIHLTNNHVIPFLKRRKYFVEKYQFEDVGKRRHLIYDPKKDLSKLLVYIFSSLTLVIPVYDSLKGFAKVRDTAWFIHPIMCLAFLYIYGYASIKHKIRYV